MKCREPLVKCQNRCKNTSCDDQSVWAVATCKNEGYPMKRGLQVAKWLTACVAVVSVWGCEGAIERTNSDVDDSLPQSPGGDKDLGMMPGGGPGGPGDEMGQELDSGPTLPEDCTIEEMALEQSVAHFLDTSCSHSGCHLPRGQRSPSLGAADLARLVELKGFDPDATHGGWLMDRIDTTDPTLIMPPIRPANRPEDITMLRSWLAQGAPTGCAPVPERVVAKGNNIPQESLFTCASPTPMSPELKRLDSEEFMLALGGTLSTRALASNPLEDAVSPFSTFGGADSLGETAMGIYMNTLEGAREFRTDFSYHGGGGRSVADQLWIKSLTQDEQDALNCIVSSRRAAADVLGDEACMVLYTQQLLQRGVLHREPSDEEAALILSFLRDELNNESEDSEPSRSKTLSYTTEATWMMTGALFPSLQGDAQGVLSVDEYGRALNRALTSAPMHGATHVNVARPEQGWLTDFHMQTQPQTKEQLQALGARIFDLDSGYVGGEFEASLTRPRPDLLHDYTYGKSAWRLPRRGRYWLAPHIAGFFREYFNYEDVSSVTKIDPLATSIYASQDFGRNNLSNMTAAFELNRDGVAPSRPTHGEPMIVEQLDDMIARAVIKAERDGGDVFEALFTSRTYRVPAVISAEGFVAYRAEVQGGCDPVACNAQGAEDCCASGFSCAMDGFDVSGEPVGSCINPSSRHRWRQLANVYHILPIEEDPATSQASEDDDLMAPQLDPTHQARWVEMPEGERAGVLTHPAWLARFGSNAEEDASAVLRGHWVREHLFCESVAGLDLVQLEAQLPVSDGTQRARDRLHQVFGDLSRPAAQRTQGDPLCSNGACHGAMNTLGMTFEVYNHAGYLRHDDHGLTPDGSTVISNWPGRQSELIEVEDATELMTMIADDPHARRCFLRHVFRYFMGRYETQADACVLADMEVAFESGSLLAALEALFTHDAYLVRGAQ